MKKRQTASILTSALCMVFFHSQAIFASEWEPITVGSYSAISGIALIPEGTLLGAKKGSGETNFLIAHDAKGRNIVTARITMKGTRLTKYEALDWFDSTEKKLLDEDTQPKDLEALTVLPYKVKEEPKFLAIQSDGKAYELEITEHPVSKKKRCEEAKAKQKPCNENTPGPESFFMVKVHPLDWILKTRKGKNGSKYSKHAEIEGVAVQSIGDKNLLVWGSRGGGKNDSSAQFCWSGYPIETQNIEVTPPKTVIEINCQEITEAITIGLGFSKPKYCLGACDRRYISDMKVDKEGNLYIVSTLDTGDDGPFDSIVLRAGKFIFSGDNIIHNSTGENKFKQVSEIHPHKVEALELLPGKDTQLVLGADDENLGGFISFYKAENIDDTKFAIVSPYVVKEETPFKISINDKSSLEKYAKIELAVRPTSLPKDSWWKSEEIPSKVDDIPWDVKSGTCEKGDDEKFILCLAFDKFEYKDKKAQSLPDKSMELEIQIQGIYKDKDEKPTDLLAKTRKTVVYFKSAKDRKLHLVSPAIMITQDGEKYSVSEGIRLQLPLPEKKHHLFFKAYPGLESEAYKMDIQGYQSRVVLLLKPHINHNTSGDRQQGHAGQILLTPRFAHFQPEYEFWVSAADRVVTADNLKEIPNNSWAEFELSLHYPGERNPSGIEVDGKLIIYKKNEKIY